MMPKFDAFVWGVLAGMWAAGVIAVCVLSLWGR